MLTCIACTKQIGGSLQPEPEQEDDDGATTPSTRQAIRSLTSQIKDMAVKASGAYRHCKPCSAGSGRFECAYERAASCNGFAGGEVSTTTSEAAADEEEEREWVAQVESGVLITFVSLSNGGNDIRRIRFSREMFNRWQAQRWWAENYDKVMELYNVDRFSRHTVPLPATPVPEDENSKLRRSPEDNPATPPPSSERLHRPTSKLSNKTEETSSVEVNSRRTSSSSSEDRSNGDISATVSNASDHDREWVEQDQPGVYITIHALPGGARELRRVRFSRERFSEMHARLWWEENRARIHQQYL